MDDIQSRHKKELKALDGEKRSAIKKAKALKGKKGKDAAESAEAEFAEKLQQMEARHEQELSEFAANHNDKAGEPEESVASAAPGIDDTQSATTTTTSTIAEGDIIQSSTNTSSIEEERLRKLEKARRKRDAKKEKERQRQDDLEREAANAGPSMRAMELEALDMQLKPLSLRIVEIPSDGNCLYRAVAAQCGSDYVAIRQLCADQLMSNPDDYAPFCEFSETIQTFDDYVGRVRSSSEWGGHLELRALSEGLKRTIVVYSAAQPKLVLGDDDDENPIMLSYHLHYYTLGEHYNQVIAGDQVEC